MIGTFSPQAEPYTHEMPEETTPSGLFARGTYSARTKVLYIYTVSQRVQTDLKFVVEFYNLNNWLIN